MTEDNTVSSFDESGYFFGPLQFVSRSELEQETREWPTQIQGWPANLHQPSIPSTSEMLMTILQEAILAKASFIHIDPNRHEYLVRYRIGGKLWEANAYLKYKCSGLSARLKRVSGVNIAERRLPQFGRFLYGSVSSLHEMRLSSVPTQQGEAFVINVQPYTGKGDAADKDILAQIHETQKGTTE